MQEELNIAFTIEKFLFPPSPVVGEYFVAACNLIKKRETDYEKIKLNEKYNNFIITGILPINFILKEEYEGCFSAYESKYGLSYNLNRLITLLNEEKFQTTFLHNILPDNLYNQIITTLSQPFETIKNKDVNTLCSVKGIKEKTANKIIQKYEENLKFYNIYGILSEFSLTPNIIKKVIETFGENIKTIQRIKQNPYLLTKIEGIGFKRADALALKAGLEPNSPQRLEAFFYYYLTYAAEQGFSWLDPKILFSQIKEYLGCEFSKETIKKVLYKMHDEESLNWNETKSKIFLQKIYNLENNIKEEINRLQNGENVYKRNFAQEETIIKNVENEIGFEFTEEQREAIETILNNNVALITGGAGVGKTQTTKVFAEILKSQNLTVALTTFSGKASARIKEATNLQGSTIHRLLGYIPNLGFSFDKENPLPYDVIIIDEGSFLGGQLFYDLISAIKENGKLYIVGDDKQLPPIGMCNVFYDMINSYKIPRVSLTKIHRQAQKSGIILASQTIREGHQIIKNGWIGKETRGELQDFTVDIYNEKIYGYPKIMEWYKKYVHNLDEAFHTQIIVPMKYRGEFSTYTLNNEIQEEYNPANSNKKELPIVKNGYNFIIREGDKVINRRNNYKAIIYTPPTAENKTQDTTPIFNGYCGKVKQIIGSKIIVKFDLCDELIEIPYEERGNLELAYALTVHLLQGSQVENAIVGIDSGSYIMNTRELVYTALTRASKSCVLVAEQKALKHAIMTSQTVVKNTFLMELLKGEKI